MIETIDGILDERACLALIERIERLGPERARVQGDWSTREDARIRNNTRVWFEDAALARTIFAAIAPCVQALQRASSATLFVGTALRCEETFRGYRYRPGEHFAAHTDAPFVLDDGSRTLLTVLVYLNGDVVGGATRFNTGAGRIDEVVPAAGRACVFLHLLEHEGSPVVSGTKYVVRTNVVFSAGACDEP